MFRVCRRSVLAVPPPRSPNANEKGRRYCFVSPSVLAGQSVPASRSVFRALWFRGSQAIICAGQARGNERGMTVFRPRQVRASRSPTLRTKKGSGDDVVSCGEFAAAGVLCSPFRGVSPPRSPNEDAKGRRCFAPTVSARRAKSSRQQVRAPRRPGLRGNEGG